MVHVKKACDVKSMSGKDRTVSLAIKSANENLVSPYKQKMQIFDHLKFGPPIWTILEMLHKYISYYLQTQVKCFLQTKEMHL